MNTYGSFLSQAERLKSSALLVLGVLLLASPSGAVTFTVNNVVNGVYPDDTTNDQRCSLREAVIAANTRQAVNPTGGADCAAGSGNDTIVLPAGQIFLTAPLDVLANTTVTIDGNGVNSSIVTANLLNDHAIGSFGTLTFREATLVGGTTHFTAGLLSGTGGALFVVDARVTNFTAAGIVGQAGTIAVTNSIVDFNVGGNGGGIAIEYPELPGDVSQRQLILDRATIRDNIAAANGGGIFASFVLASVTKSVINDNEASEAGGGLYTFDASPTIFDTTIAGNVSFSGGGGIALGSNSSTGNIEHSLIANNSTQGDGGGILCRGQQVHLNVTIDGNSAQRGGGIFHEGRETRFSHLTLVGNSASLVGGGIWMSPANSVFHGNIIATNTAPSSPDVFSTVNQDFGTAFNLIGNNQGVEAFFPNGQNGNIVGVDPLLGPLQSLGGFTQVRPLLDGSPAIDRIPQGTFETNVDQRGFPRPQNGRDGGNRDGADIGAFEQGPNDAVMGFETLGAWSSSVPLSLNPTTKTQGRFGLSVGGSAYRVLNSALLVTPVLPIGSELRLDVFLPPNQPNPQWFGAVQASASCPSVAMNNEYLGQVELTGKPVNAFSTLTFSVPANVRTVLSQNRPDCFLSIAVNTNATPVSPVLDNLRFAP